MVVTPARYRVLTFVLKNPIDVAAILLVVVLVVYLVMTLPEESD